VVAPARTTYAKSGTVHVAYQVVGNGPLDLIFIPSAFSHVESNWEEPSVARFLRRLASFARLIIFDKRGTGMSDRVEGVPTLDERVDDIRAVMKAVGSEKAALFGMSEGGSMATLFAATYPEKVSALIAMGSGAVGFVSEADAERVVEILEASWGSGDSLAFGAPSVADDERIRQWAGTVERRGASPGTMAEMIRMNAAFDIRAALSSISAPTLVVHRTGDLTYPLDHGRYLAEHIRGARFVELAGTDHLPYWEQPDTILDLIEEFVTGSHRAPDAQRVLATTLFTDIVSSTAHASRVGDRRWRETLDDFDTISAREIDHFGGRLIKTTGDGTLATFDGPTRATRCACAIRDAARQLGVAIRAGLHTGEIELRGDDVTGLGVVIGQRVSALAGEGEVLASSTVRDLSIGSGIVFTERGEYQLKGVPGSWHIFTVDA
jgi:pimeloyl-ACP methyl ester carboxylesterase